MLAILRRRLTTPTPASYSQCIQRLYASETRQPEKFKSKTSGDAKESDAELNDRYERFLKEKEKEGPLRPKPKVPGDSEHGLFAFFRQVKTSDGAADYQLIEQFRPDMEHSGRAWNAFDLRRKSFKDLHTLWYILLRERNLLATQRATAKRLGLLPQNTKYAFNDRMCRKSMARIKQVINERRLAYENALSIRRERNSTTSSEQDKTAITSPDTASSPTQGRRKRQRVLAAATIARANSVSGRAADPLGADLVGDSEGGPLPLSLQDVTHPALPATFATTAATAKSVLTEQSRPIV